MNKKILCLLSILLISIILIEPVKSGDVSIMPVDIPDATPIPSNPPPISITSDTQTIYLGELITVVFTVNVESLCNPSPGEACATSTTMVPLSGASVKLQGAVTGNLGTTSDQGQFVTTINAADTGTITVTASKSGYTDGSITINVENRPKGTLSVTTTPVSGNILVDGVYKGAGSWSGPLDAGSHTVSFGDISGYTTPSSQTVSANTNQQTSVTGTYVLIQTTGTLSVSTTPVSGNILVDGVYKGAGSWSGYVENGGHTVSFGDISGYTTPSSQTVSVNTGQTTYATGTYVPILTPTPKEDKFRVGPTVRIRPINDEIKKDQDGLVELYMDNPGLNSVSLTVDIRISVPSGIHVYGQGFGEGTAAGMVYGKFEVPPGSARTVNIVIKAEKTGDFSAQFTGTYYPDDNKDAYQPISLTHPFKVIIPISTVSITTPSTYVPIDTPIRTTQVSESETHVSIYGEKTDVIINEDILLRLSAVNLINKPMMTVQVILYPPSGMSVTGQEFVKSGAGIYTTTYKLDPSDSKDIEIKIKPNQIGDFNVKGVIVYYFDNDKNSSQTITKILPIKVSENKEDIKDIQDRNVPGFEIIASIIILLIIRFSKNK